VHCDEVQGAHAAYMVSVVEISNIHCPYTLMSEVHALFSIEGVVHSTVDAAFVEWRSRGGGGRRMKL
jgi:hypothetical protein